MAVDKIKQDSGQEQAVKPPTKPKEKRRYEFVIGRLRYFKRLYLNILIRCPLSDLWKSFVNMSFVFMSKKMFNIPSGSGVFAGK